MPGVVLGASALYLAFGRIDWKVRLCLFLLVTAVELALHIVSAYFWNKRASRLQKVAPAT